MQTDRGIYHKRVCDRCGAVLSGSMMNPDECFKDWAWRRVQATFARSAMRSISE